MTRLLGLLLVIVANLHATRVEGASSVISQSLRRQIARDGTVTVVVEMREPSSAALRRLEAQDPTQDALSASRGERIEAIVDALERHASTTQADVLEVLETAVEAHRRRLRQLQGVAAPPPYTSVKSFWITNSLIIEDASADVIETLSQLPMVVAVRAPVVGRFGANAAVIPAGHRPLSSWQPDNFWSTAKINAPAYWRQGRTGQGIVVGSIDSGVRGTHKALRHNFRRDHGWYDPELQRTEPYDVQGHGSHTLGSIIGSNGIGVAPGAQWIACKVCNHNGTELPEEYIVGCMQFMLCPTDPMGGDKNCSLAPHVVSNSWSLQADVQSHADAVQAWRHAGIVPVFSIGNLGLNGCGTTTYPGALPTVLAVGAVDDDDALVEFSSRGPTQDGRIKPDLVAPGRFVLSASRFGDALFTLNSGTSMAAPHVAGAVALLLQANHSASSAALYAALTAAADKTLQLPQADEDNEPPCGTGTDRRPVNNEFGHGRLFLPDL